MFTNETISVAGKKKAIGKIYKAFSDYRARESAKNKLYAKRVLKKYKNLPQEIMVIKKVVQSEEPEQQLKQNYKQIAIINKPKSGGLMTDRFRVKDIIQQENKEEQSQAENIARETIGNRLIALNYKRDLLNELNLRKEISTNAGEKQTVRTVLEQALTGMRDKLEAKKELERKKLLKNIENEAKLKDISTSQDQIRIKNIYASVVQDATNSALSRLVELEGKQYIAKHLATESPTVELRKSTLAQKLGLEERDQSTRNLFSSNNNRNESMELALVPYTGGKTKRGRLVKGSQEAKDYMARLRAMRKPKTAKATTVAPAQARDIAALLKRANFRPRTKPRGRPRKDAKVFDPTVYPFPSSTVVPARDIAALLKRANFRPRTKPRGRPRKDAKVFYGY
jgi:hypothetical protein